MCALVKYPKHDHSMPIPAGETLTFCTVCHNQELIVPTGVLVATTGVTLPYCGCEIPEDSHLHELKPWKI